MSLTNDKAKIDAIKQVALMLVKNMDSGMNDMIVPFVSNLVYKYAFHKEVIDDVVKIIGYKEGDEYVKALSNVMLDPKCYEAIASKTEISESAAKPFRDQMEKRWEEVFN